MISGWPGDTSESVMKRCLQDNHLPYGGIMVNFRHSVAPYCVLAFKSNKAATNIVHEWIQNASTDGLTPIYHHINESRPLENPTPIPLFVRFATPKEFNIKRTVKSMIDAIKRSSDCVKVSNVAWNVTEQEILDIVSAYGKIVNIQMVPRKDFFCGYALITYEKENDARNTILHVNGIKLKGYTLQASFHVRQSRDDKKSIRQLYSLKQQELAESRRKEFTLIFACVLLCFFVNGIKQRTQNSKKKSEKQQKKSQKEKIATKVIYLYHKCLILCYVIFSAELSVDLNKSSKNNF
ncbi:hypothetical protein RFI_09357 [Reticulomyxa filosa]|uniref:RRM domain-containing protein n=1 Tax=Reticulomyxa filosa TaxID=46433 RepID=X6NNB2_RETFI|nr:hypothetical protein RFI_09357 [Reticulomyxa filosa]|eukprot:ETO27775.1 hypothetical protein RFI_09357 [Reticulomyxa filosa]